MKKFLIIIAALMVYDVFPTEATAEQQKEIDLAVQKANNPITDGDSKFIEVTDLIKLYAPIDELPQYVFTDIDPYPYKTKHLAVLYTGANEAIFLEKPWDNPPKLLNTVDAAAYGYFEDTSNRPRDQFLKMLGITIPVSTPTQETVQPAPTPTQETSTPSQVPPAEKDNDEETALCNLPDNSNCAEECKKINKIWLRDDYPESFLNFYQLNYDVLGHTYYIPSKQAKNKCWSEGEKKARAEGITDDIKIDEFGSNHSKNTCPCAAKCITDKCQNNNDCRNGICSNFNVEGCGTIKLCKYCKYGEMLIDEKCMTNAEVIQDLYSKLQAQTLTPTVNPTTPAITKTDLENLRQELDARLTAVKAIPIKDPKTEQLTQQINQIITQVNNISDANKNQTLSKEETDKQVQNLNKQIQDLNNLNQTNISTAIKDLEDKIRQEVTQKQSTADDETKKLNQQTKELLDQIKALSEANKAQLLIQQQADKKIQDLSNQIVQLSTQQLKTGQPAVVQSAKSKTQVTLLTKQISDLNKKKLEGQNLLKAKETNINKQLNVLAKTTKQIKTKKPIVKTTPSIKSKIKK